MSAGRVIMHNSYIFSHNLPMAETVYTTVLYATTIFSEFFFCVGLRILHHHENASSFSVSNQFKRQRINCFLFFLNRKKRKKERKTNRHTRPAKQ